MAGIGWEFEKLFAFNGSAYTDVTLDAQRPSSAAFAILAATNHFFYLGHQSKFDMAIFDVETAGSLGTLKYEYYNDSAWTEFIPASARYSNDPDDDEGEQYAFDKNGAELFPINLLDSWATTAVNSVTKYWVRISSPTSVTTAPTIKRIQCRPFAIYTTSKLVYELLQLKNVLSGTDFTTTTVPSKETVDFFINESQAYIDMNTRKSWRPNMVYDEHHQFNLNGMKLEMPDAQRVLQLKIWNGASWDIKRQGRTKDYFYVPETGMVQFSRYFLLPARFTSYNAPVWRWGGGEFTMPVKVTYLAGRDINTDIVQAGIIQEVCKKMVAIDVMRNADFGNTVVSGMDRVSMESRIQGWQEEIEDRLDFLTAFEVF
jgi:hypothetical protein